MAAKKKISIIANVRNEEKNLRELHERITKISKKIPCTFEIIYVENGSSDRSLEILKSLKNAVIISLRVPIPPLRSTQTDALDAGIKHATGDILVTIDSDLQNPPEEIPKLIEKLEKEDLDVVSGWRKKRNDSLGKKIISRIGSYFRSKVINPGVHDLGCTLKAYRTECFDNVDLYGEMHRYIVAILRWRGFRIGEVVVEHDSRKHGNSAYNWRKIFRGFVDMWQIWFWQKYSDRPLHLFGISGMIIAGSGTILLATLGILRLFRIIALGDSIWPLIAVLMIIVGIQFFIFGIITDILIRNFYASRNETTYSIREIVKV